MYYVAECKYYDIWGARSWQRKAWYIQVAGLKIAESTSCMESSQTQKTTGYILAQKSRWAAREKTLVWLKEGEAWLADLSVPQNRLMSVISKNAPGKVVRIPSTKYLSGRESKIPFWMEILHWVLFEEFWRLRALGLKLDREYLLVHMLSLLEDLTFQLLRLKLKTKLVKRSKKYWISQFFVRFNIALRLCRIKWALI